MMLRPSLVAFVLAVHGVFAFAPATLSKKRAHDVAMASPPLISDKSSDDPTSTTLHLPPGRRTPRFFSFLFDDSLRLLNPKTMGTYQLRRKAQYGDVFKTNLLGKHAVMAVSQDALAALGKEEARGTMEAFFPPHHQSLFGTQSLIVQSGDTHTRLRTLVQPILSPAVIKEIYQPIIAQAIDTLLEDLQAESADTNREEESYIAMVPKLRAFFISIALQILLGTDKANEIPDGLAEDLTTWSKGLLAAPLTFVPWSTAARAARARKRISSVLEPLVEQERRETNDKSLLGRLVSSTDEQGNTLSNQDILDNVLTLIFAGSDTTASAATSLVLALSLQPELKAQLAAKANDKDMANAIVHQILELYPPAPFNMRLTKEPVTLQGYDIPTGWLVTYGFAGALAEDDEENKEQTKTLQTLPETTAASSSVAFGAGPRMCPGRFLAVLELSMLCTKLLPCNWELEEGQNLQQTYTPGFFPKDGLKIRFL